MPMIKKEILTRTAPKCDGQINVLTLRNDSSCSMHEVRLNDIVIHMGNTWDWKPEVMNSEFRFYGPRSYFDTVATYLEKQGHIVVKNVEDYDYYDEYES